METKINVIDEMMGRGKSSAAINYINTSSPDEHFLVITPYLDEIKRYKLQCESRHFKEPIYNNGSKLDNIKELIRNGENIVSTHALFRRFDEETINICQVLNYTLIMDEVADVVEEYYITQKDIECLLNNYCYVDDSGKMTWREDAQDYEGKFSEIKQMCNLGAMIIARQKMMLWLFPVEAFKAFDNVFILTYMFNAQIQRYYYDYYGVNYKHMYVTGNSLDTYAFSDVKDMNEEQYDYSSLIHILDHRKLNAVGEIRAALSKTWYLSNAKSAVMKQLQKNVVNFFTNICSVNSKDAMWTTFKEYKGQLSGKGYTKGYLPINARATNEFRERTHLAYLVNRFLNPMVKGFFQDHGVTVNDEDFALSEMLQWIWRSAIRDGKEIWIYIPSLRMRELLKEWINDNSISVA